MDFAKRMMSFKGAKNSDKNIWKKKPPKLSHLDWEQEMDKDYGLVLSWAVCNDSTPSEDDDMIMLLRNDREQIESQRGWNLANPIMLAAEFNNIAKLRMMLALIEPNRLPDVLNRKNSLENTALILAAIEGNLEIVQLLADNGADINIQNLYGHTAVMLAIEHGQIEVAKWLLRRDPSGVEILNQYGKNPLFVAAEFAYTSDGKIIIWMLTEFREENNFANKQYIDKVINRPANNGRTPIFFACKGKHSGEIVRMLIDCGAEANFIAKSTVKLTKEVLRHDTCLMWAAKDNNLAAAKVLLALDDRRRPDIFFCSDDGKTALSSAAGAGKKAFVDYLVQHLDKIKNPRNESQLEAKIVHDKRVSMKVAWQEGHVNVATFLMMNLGIELNKPLKSIFDENEIDGLKRAYVKPEFYETRRMLAGYAAKYDFHLELFLLLIPCYASPSSVLNKQLPVFYEDLFARIKQKDVDLVYVLVRLMAFINLAAANHQMQKIDLQQRIDAIKDMLRECIASDCMDDASTVQKMLCCAVDWSRDKRFQVSVVEKAQAFALGPLVTSLDYDVSALFCTGHVATFVDSIFWGFLRMPRQSTIHKSSVKTVIHQLLHSLDKEVGHLKLLKSRFIFFRFSPAMMFFGEALSRLFFVIVVAMVAIGLRNDSQKYIDSDGHSTVLERILLILLLANLLYEYGQICQRTTSILPSTTMFTKHFQIGWNQCNMVGLFLVMLWALTTYVEFSISESLAGDLASGALSTSLIFFVTGLLRYLSIYEPVGKLVIMVIAMLKELAAFALVYFVSCAGFCITLYCVMWQATGFDTFSDSILTLFAASLGNFDSSYEDLAVASPFRSLTLTISVVFIIVSNVVLLNLIIARMSAVHEKIDERSFQEWQFLRAVRTKRFLLLDESHPFCMLPPPLNIIPISLFLAHKFWLMHVHNRLQKRLVELTPNRELYSNRLFTSMRGQHKKTAYQRFRKWISSCFNDAAISPSTQLELKRESARTPGGYISVDDGSKSSNINRLDKTCLTKEQELELHKLAKAVSICGTATDIFAGIIMAFIAPFIEMVVAVHSKYNRSFGFLTTAGNILFTVFVFIGVYIPFVLSLLWEAAHTHTIVKLELDEKNPKTIVAIKVQYLEETRYARIRVKEEEGNGRITKQPSKIEKTIGVRVIKTFGLADITGFPPRNPIIKIRLGHLEAVITDSVRNYEDGTDLWTHKKIPFPIDIARLINDPKYKLSIKVVDFDSTTNEEVVLGYFSNRVTEFEAESLNADNGNNTDSKRKSDIYDSFSIRECIANKKFEGKLRIDDSQACVQVVIEAQVQKTLHHLLTLSKSEKLSSRSLMSSQSFTFNQCEEDESFDRDIFTEKDRDRIFSKSGTRHLSFQSAARVAFESGHICSPEKAAATAMVAMSTHEVQQHLPQTPTRAASEKDKFSRFVDSSKPILIVKGNHASASKLDSENGTVDSESKAEAGRQSSDGSSLTASNAKKVVSIAPGVPSLGSRSLVRGTGFDIHSIDENIDPEARTSRVTLPPPVQTNSPAKVIGHINANSELNDIDHEGIARRDREIKQLKERLSTVLASNSIVFAEKDRRIAELEKLIQVLREK